MKGYDNRRLSEPAWFGGSQEGNLWEGSADDEWGPAHMVLTLCLVARECECAPSSLSSR